MLWIFLLSLAAFVAVILLLAWYTRFVSDKIYGNMNAELHAVVYEGIPPAEWDVRLLKKLLRCTDEAQRKRVCEKHLRYATACLDDMRVYVEKTSLIPEEEKIGMLDALKNFREAYLPELRGKIIPSQDQ